MANKKILSPCHWCTTAPGVSLVIFSRYRQAVFGDFAEVDPSCLLRGTARQSQGSWLVLLGNTLVQFDRVAPAFAFNYGMVTSVVPLRQHQIGRVAQFQ